jgi:hypothetical protein
MLKKILVAVILACLACLIYACGEEQNSINGKVVSSLSIAPTSATVPNGSFEVFSTNATFTDGTNGPVQATWSTTNGIGTATKVVYNCLFTATSEGTGEVIASAGGLTAVATVTVTAGPTSEPGGLTTIEVSPATLDMPVGGTQMFTASGLNGSGESIGITPSWSINNTAIGTFTFSGTTATLESTAKGLAVITCSSGEITATVSVTIEGTIAIITAEADTYVDESSPTTSFESSTSLKAGYLTASPAEHFETYLRFSLASLPAGITSFESVQLQVYATSADSPSFSVYGLSSGFDATTTWNSRPTNPSSGTFIASSTFTAGQYNSLSSDALTTAVKSWYATPAANFGLAIVQPGGSNGTVVFLSKEDSSKHPPILNITYK